MTYAIAKRELAALGYGLSSWQRDCWKKQWRYCTRPIPVEGTIFGGGHNYFDNLAQVEKYIKQVKEVRSWQTDTL